MSENDMTILDLMRSDGYITVNKKLAKTIGLHESIIYGELLSRYFYFANHNKLTDDGYFFNTIEDLEEATTLTRNQQPTAIKNLCELQLIECKTKGLPARRYFKINNNQDVLLKILSGNRLNSQFTENQQTSKLKISKLDSGKSVSNNTIINNTIINKNNQSSTHENVSVFSLEIFKKQIKACYKKLNPDSVYFSLEEIFEIVDYFMISRSQKTNIQHQNLSNETVTDILLNLTSCSHSDGTEFTIDADNYREMTDFYFEQNFKGNKYGQCDYSLAHFILSQDIRANCFYKTCY